MSTRAIPAAAAGADAASARAVSVTTYGTALVSAAVLAHFLLGLPIQVSDTFGHMLQLTASWPELLEARVTQPGFLRPLHWASLKLVYDASGGDYYTWFRGLHALQSAVLMVAFVALVRPATWRAAALVPLALAVLLGVHTFAGLVREAYPINHYLTVTICCVAAALLVLGPHRWWNDLAMVVLFVVATLTIETGLLVWVIAIGGVLVGGRGLSRRGVVTLVVLLALYLFARFGPLDVGAPALTERSSGFGFAVLDPPQLAARFGGNPLPFYLYNVGASTLSVVLSEPTAGVFRVTRDALAGTMPAYMAVNVVASAGVLVLLAAFARTRWRAWRERVLTRDDRLVLLFALVLLANAAISYPYTKDVIMAPAGVFLAAAAYAAARHFVEVRPLRVDGARAAVLVAVVLVVSTAWSLRLLGLHTRLRAAAVTERLDWAYIDSEAPGMLPAGGEGRLLLDTLRHGALVARPAPPPLRLPLQSLFSE
jgi:hypothetical protein